MSAINKAFKTVSPASGGNNIAKAVNGATKKNPKSGVSKLSMTDVIDEEKKIKDGETDESAEVAKTDDEKDTGATTQKTDSEQAAKKATKTPKEKLNGILETMGAKIDEHREQMASRSAEAQTAAMNADQMKQAQELQRMEQLAAMQQAKQKPQATPKASSPSPRKRSSSSEAAVLKKMAEKQKQNQEQVNKLTKALKEQKESSSSKEVASKLKEAQKIIDAQKAKESNSGDKTRSSEGKVKFDFVTVDKLQSRAKEAMREGGISQTDAEKILLGLNKVADATDNENITNTLNEFKTFMEKGSTSIASRSGASHETQNFNLEEYGGDSFSLNDDLPSRANEKNLELASRDITEDSVTENEDTTNDTEETLALAEQQDESLDELLEDL